MINLTYNTWMQFIDACEYGVSDRPDTNRRSRDTNDFMRFFHTNTYTDAVQLARAGWSEGTTQALALFMPLQDRLYSVIEQTTIHYDTTGSILDIGRYVSSEPEHWGEFSYSKVTGPGTKYIHIVVNGTASGNISGHTLIARGVAITALINTLELAGHRVHVSVTYPIRTEYKGKEPAFTATVTVKAYDESPDLDRIVYATAHPSALRRHIFSLLECQSDAACTELVRGGFGYPGDTAPGAQGDIYIPHMTSDDAPWSNPDKTFAWIIGYLEQQGVLAAQPTA